METQRTKLKLLKLTKNDFCTYLCTNVKHCVTRVSHNVGISRNQNACYAGNRCIHNLMVFLFYLYKRRRKNIKVGGDILNL